MTKKEKAVFDSFYNRIVSAYSKVLKSDDPFLKENMDSYTSNFCLITDLKEALDKCNEVGA